MKIDHLVNELEIALNGDLPGREAQVQMAPKVRAEIERRYNYPDDAIESAVLLALFERNNELHLPAIVRTNTGGVHGGQISFPGGRLEHYDQDHFSAAIRETEEEIGIDASGSRFLGGLSELFIPVSNYMVRPFLVFLEKEPQDYLPEDAEVDSILEIPLSPFYNKKNREEGTITTNKGFKINAPYFPVEGRKLWGASAMILGELLGIIDQIRERTL